ncbi:anthranilate synthase component I [Campylobacter blaseri]|uniref:Anthranilate synthase component 1 n=1 Tax=Campylobacter blaseri TaxID=2042961 RepID=A0A2P8R2E5_9BACT|nr:anthranilate synthase component I family protein [Campylobacter blaseri]PSM52662.1 anthranilate synthase component I [Campylobacter blaseri]PSM54310.1 anthranilate synthase component I [Campylobacter blaseri]QKF85961.1 anthranilate synthase component I [Campylobacter blaseri]
MLLLEPIVYYKQILKDYKNSFLAEDNFQVIIGINAKYIDGKTISFDDFKQKFYEAKKEDNTKAPFAGLFGITSYEMVDEFEVIGENKKSLYKFPKFIYANASSYLHYDKISKIYTYYGTDFKYYDKLKELKTTKDNIKEDRYYTIKTNLKDEKEYFDKMVKTAKKYIENGDVFQVVLSQILEISTNLDSLKFYIELKANNPSPYMFHFPTPYGDVVGSSPELIMEIRDSEIFVAPIAGTRSRGRTPNEDEKLKKELLKDEKELAEHRMLIDLARNDIGKFAKAGSVRVKNPMQVVKYEHVMHIVSEVYGKKPKNVSSFDILSVVFPAGTLSGSPKIRAMQIINELECSKRGIYGGGIGFWHFNGDVQMAILIRSAIFIPNKKDDKNLVFIGAGAGIVYDSISKNEYSEICKKRRSCLRVIEKLCKEID